MGFNSILFTGAPAFGEKKKNRRLQKNGEKGLQNASVLVINGAELIDLIVRQGSSDPFHIVSYYIKWVTTFWTHGRTAEVCHC